MRIIPLSMIAFHPPCDSEVDSRNVTANPVMDDQTRESDRFPREPEGVVFQVMTRPTGYVGETMIAIEHSG
jgi:hypothetical protein